MPELAWPNIPPQAEFTQAEFTQPGLPVQEGTGAVVRGLSVNEVQVVTKYLWWQMVVAGSGRWWENPYRDESLG